MICLKSALCFQLYVSAIERLMSVLCGNQTDKWVCWGVNKWTIVWNEGCFSKQDYLCSIWTQNCKETWSGCNLAFEISAMHWNALCLLNSIEGTVAGLCKVFQMVQHFRLCRDYVSLRYSAEGELLETGSIMRKLLYLIKWHACNMY